MMILLPFLLFILLGFLLFFYFFGLLWALVLSLLWAFLLALLVFFAERIALARVRGLEVPWYDPFLTLAGQEAYRLGFKKRPLVFETVLMPHSFCYLQSFSKKNYLLIGQKLRAELSENELRALTVLALIRLKSEQGKNHFPSAFLFALLSLPGSWAKHPRVVLFWDFFFFPLRSLMDYLFVSKKNIFLCDERALLQLKQGADLTSALYKLQTAKEVEFSSRLASFVFPLFSLASGETSRVMKSFFGDAQLTQERYRKLTASLRRAE